MKHFDRQKKICFIFFLHGGETATTVYNISEVGNWNYGKQRAKKVLSDSPGLVDFAIGLVNSVFNLPDGQVMFYEEFE